MTTASTASKKWEEVQKKAFKHWVNSQLAKRNESIDDLEEGFGSGVQLITLVEVLSGKKITTKWTKKPQLKVHKITNCFIALKFLAEDCQVKGLTISAEDIVNGDRLTLVLGFCWMLLRHFQQPLSNDESKGSSYEQNLLAWIKKTLAGYKDLDFSDGFKSGSFSNGKALLAMINEFNGSLIDYKSFAPTNKLLNCETGLKVAEEKAGIPTLIDPAELAEGKCEEKNLVLYFSLWYNAFKELQSGESQESLLRRLKELEEKLRILLAENEALKLARSQLEHSTTDLKQKLKTENEEKSVLLSSKNELESKLGKLKDTYASEKSALNAKIKELEQNLQMLKSKSDGNTTQLQNAKDELARERDAIREELKKLKDQLTKENEELQHQNDEALANVNRTKKLKEELEEIMKKQDESHKATIAVLRKHLLRHLRDMQIWREHLESDREYKVKNVEIPKEDTLAKQDFVAQIQALDNLQIKENTFLSALLEEREKEVVEVVSVNMGKKKKRIKKGLELEAEEAKNAQAKADSAKAKKKVTSTKK